MAVDLIKPSIISRAVHINMFAGTAGLTVHPSIAQQPVSVCPADLAGQQVGDQYGAGRHPGLPSRLLGRVVVVVLHSSTVLEGKGMRGA